MKLTLNKNDFVNNILNPASKLADNLLLDFQPSDYKAGWATKTIVNSADNSVIFIGETPCMVENPFKCVVPDCKTFLRLFSGIDQEQIELVIESNVIKYKDSNFSFKYHLLDENCMVSKKSISEDKLNQLEYDLNFSTNKSKISEILKFNSIIPDAEKMYFFTKDKKVFVKIGDDQKCNTNEIVTETSNSFEGESLLDPLPLNIQNMLLMSFAEDIIQISINQKLKIIKFYTSQVKYIVSGLVK